MELSDECQREIERIKLAMDCPFDFHCQRLSFEDLSPVDVYAGANVIQCQGENRLSCPQCSVLSSGDIGFCMCPLRKYLALNLDK